MRDNHTHGHVELIFEVKSHVAEADLVAPPIIVTAPDVCAAPTFSLLALDGIQR